MRHRQRSPRTWIAALIGLVGVLSGLALPFAPVFTDTTTISWPAPGQPTLSSAALVVPYRPQQLTATVPCAALRTVSPTAVSVLDTGTGGLSITDGADGATLRTGDVEVRVPLPGRTDCAVRFQAGPAGVSITQADGRVTRLAGQPVPRVFGMHTDLDPAAAEGLSLTAVIAAPFTTTPTAIKAALLTVQLLAAGAALVLLRSGRGAPLPLPSRWSRLWLIDAAMIATFCGWAVIGPLAVDDGWATMIARHAAMTGNPGNYYRWWDAAEVPFAFSQQLLAPLTEVSIAPLWLRLPSTVLATATWFVLSRGVLAAALPTIAATARVRILAALALLCAWLPFNLGTRPESFVALGVTAALALAWRARTPSSLGWLALVCALTVPISPTGVLVLAPVLVFAGRLRAAARHGPHSRLTVAALVGAVGAVGLTVIFADQTWDALVTATDWHAFFGPSLPWYEEPTRYRYLLQADQQGSFAKRMPILVGVALLPVATLLALRRRDRTAAAMRRLAAVLVVMLALFAVVPSKWSYHFGAGAGVVAAFVTVAIVALACRSRIAGRREVVVGVVGSVLLAATVALAFAGPNAWWLPNLYDLPWASSPIRPADVPLDNPVLWIGLLAAGTLAMLSLRRSTPAPLLALGPAVLTLVAFGTVLTVLVASFAAAPVRRPEGSLALANLHRIASTRVCGLADDIEVLPDGEVLTAAESDSSDSGFAIGAGFYPGAPPPDAPGSGTSQYLWGSWTTGPGATADVTTPWFTLPPLADDSGLALSVSGRTTDGNALRLEFGSAGGSGVAPTGARVPVDRPAADETPDKPLWRSIGVDAAEVPAGSDRVRIRATDGRTDERGWLAFTGPRLRSTVPLSTFLAANGPVLISWPQAFLFPCVHNNAVVSGGVAQTPRTVIESPRPWLTDDRNPAIGGTFAGLSEFASLGEIPSRVVGHPEIDWGSVRVSPPVQDRYARATTRSTNWGVGSPGPRPER
ncbi:arabinosyltransferase domain-containing protein [Mycobacterium sp. PSTR-4-N]|uniref:arabinosyltransferase domain-containing protein n=1 Tax=Mycobacterium sp. PSTR-4-N TaxID=2917745 RepID=UPI001F15256A|nr:arabinosyltransferase domain-containing protein [Mycobacterium sp. PSTR-4-N]MCG7595165.1 arabinosyltransferase domain-containing protein [Mycobacterium sp. PSTR-4-N]